MKMPRMSSRLDVGINMIPFTDVVLVLLVVFMVTTPLLIQGQIKVRLPKAKSQSQEQGQATTVTVAADGRIYLRDSEVPLDQLSGLLKAAFGQTEDKMVIVNADKDALHGRVVAVLDAAKEAGADRLAIATAQPK